MEIQGLNDLKSYYAKCKITNSIIKYKGNDFVLLPYKNSIRYNHNKSSIIIPVYHNDNEIFKYSTIRLDDLQERYYKSKVDFIVYKVMIRVAYSRVLIFSDNDFKVGFSLLNYRGNLELDDYYLVYSDTLCIRVDKKTWHINIELLKEV